jgi:hypothetical protein
MHNLILHSELMGFSSNQCSIHYTLNTELFTLSLQVKPAMRLQYLDFYGNPNTTQSVSLGSYIYFTAHCEYDGNTGEMCR